MSSTRSDLRKYFQKIQCDFKPVSQLSTDACLEYLTQLFTSHIYAFPFHNFELREASHLHPLFRKKD